MFRQVSVKRLFFLLLAAIIGLLLLFFLYGPFLDEGVEDAVVQALLKRTETSEEGSFPAEGHKIFQVVRKEDSMQVWGAFCTGVFRNRENVPELAAVSEAVPARMTFIQENGGWVLSEYREVKEEGFFGKDMKDIFPWHLRLFAILTGWFEGGLRKQLEAYSPG